MPNRPTDNLFWIVFQAYRMARKRGFLPQKVPEGYLEQERELEQTATPVADEPAVASRPDAKADEALHADLGVEVEWPKPPTETVSVGECYTDPTEAEAVADRRLVQAIVQAADTAPRRNRRRLFDEGADADDVVAERPLPQLKTRIEELAEYFAQRKEFKSLDMYYLVIYDIQDNRIRTHLFNYLKERGLYHLQKSVFLGRSDRGAYQRIYEATRRIESKLAETDSIVFMPIAENELRKFRIVGRDVEVSAALDEPHTLVF